MKKIILLSTLALLITGVTFADGGKNKKKCCAKNKACCSKSKACCKGMNKTASM